MSLTPAKYKVSALLLTVLVCLELFTPDVVATFINAPQNTLATVGQSVTFNCSSTNGYDQLAWLLSRVTFINNFPPCTANPKRAATVRTTYGTQNCDVTFLNINVTDAGPISCQETDTELSADAEVILLQASSCGLPANTAVVRGTTITIPCRFDYIKQAFTSSFAPTMSTYSNWTDTSSSNVLSVSSPTIVNAGDKTGSIVSSINVAVTGTVVPSVTCTGMFTYTAPTVPDPRFQYALNSVSTSCVTPAITNVQYCPTTVTITPALPSTGQILAGTVFNCSSDGLPTPSYTWTITGGTISSASGSTTAVTSGGPFTLTCIATGTVGSVQPCTANATISGTSIVPTTTAAPATTTAAAIVAAVTTASGNGQQTTVQGQTTVASTGGNGDLTTSGRGTGNVTTASGGSNNNNNIIAIIAATIPASLIFLALSSLGCYYCWAIAGADDRRRRRTSEDETPPRAPEDIGRPWSLAFYQAVYGRPPRAKTSAPGKLDMIPPNKPSTSAQAPTSDGNLRSKYVTSAEDQRSTPDKNPFSRVSCPGGQYASTEALMLTPGLYNNLANSNPNLLMYRSCDHVNSTSLYGPQRA